MQQAQVTSHPLTAVRARVGDLVPSTYIAQVASATAPSQCPFDILGRRQGCSRTHGASLPRMGARCPPPPCPLVMPLAPRDLSSVCVCALSLALMYDLRALSCEHSICSQDCIATSTPYVGLGQQCAVSTSPVAARALPSRLRSVARCHWRRLSLCSLDSALSVAVIPWRGHPQTHTQTHTHTPVRADSLQSNLCLSSQHPKAY
jgi:hypothetical protein